MKKILAKIAGIATMFAMTFGVAFAVSPNTLPICHATESESNPYNVIYVDPNGYNGHGDHEGDIIPITDLDNNGVINDIDCDISDDENNNQCDGPCEQDVPVCVEGNLVVNGGFEFPVAPLGGWDIYDSGTPGLGWSVAWNGAFVGAPAVAKLELHNGVGGWLPDEGSQHAELDADWGFNDGEEASVEISQTVVTVPGAEYELSYAFSPRPGTVAGNNVLEVFVDGSSVQTQGPIAGAGNTSWTTYTYSFIADDASTTIAFEDDGTPDSLGTFLDDVSLNCEEMPPEETCPAYELVMARIKFAKIANGAAVDGWKNWAPGGDLVPQVFVGGTNPATNELAGNVYDDEEWFPLTNPDGSFITDPLFSFDVPGIAVQRVAGSVRVVLYGYHDGEELGGKEFAQAGLEISTNANFEAGLMSPLDQSNLNTNPRTHDPYVNDAANPMESRGAYTGYINQYDYRFDKMRTINPNRINFHLVVTAGSDGFYAHYDVGELDCLEVEVDQNS